MSRSRRIQPLTPPFCREGDLPPDTLIVDHSRSTCGECGVKCSDLTIGKCDCGSVWVNIAGARPEIDAEILWSMFPSLKYVGQAVERNGRFYLWLGQL